MKNSSSKRSLPNVTLCALTSVDIPATVKALEYSCRGIDFGDVVLVTDRRPSHLPENIRYSHTTKLENINDFNYKMVYELGSHIHTDFAMIVHADGFIVHPECWRDEFLDYDYIGSPWPLPPEGDNTFRKEGNRLTVTGITLNEAESREDLVMGLVKYTAMGGRVWMDRGEEIENLPGAVIRLTDSEGTELQSQTTDESGSWRFSGLMPGEYRIEAELPEGTVAVEPDDERLESGLISVIRDRSRYRNCTFLLLAFLSLIPLITALSGPFAQAAAVVLLSLTGILILAVPVLLIYNGFVMMKREGRRFKNLLSLFFGLFIAVGEVSAILFMWLPQIEKRPSEDAVRSLPLLLILTFVSAAYLSLCFLSFLVYSWFLQLIPRRRDFDYVINFAAESHVDRSIKDPFTFARTNVMGTLSLLQAAKLYWESLPEKYEGKRFYHISTDEVYGALSMTHPEGIEPPFTTKASSSKHHEAYGEDFFYETTKYNPHSPYSASKASSDHFVRAFHDTYGMPTIVTNCSNNYGPYQFPEKLIPLFINNIRNRKPLPVYGKGENVRDWLFVEDHARAIDVIFHNGKIAETYNIGGFNEWKNIDIIKVVINTVDRLLGRKEGEDMNLITYVTDRLGHDARYAIDSTKLQKELGWEPSLQFEEGIEKTVKWYLENQEWMDNITSGDYEKYYESMYAGR